MAEVFNFTGKIALGKETEKFKPIERKEFTSSWMNTTVKFNCLSGTNRILCTVQGGKWKSDVKNVIRTFSKTTTDANGNTVKGEKLEIAWDKRFDKNEIDKVAGFKKFICDLGDVRMRYKLQDLVKAFKNGTATDEKMAEVEIYNLADAEAALEKSEAKKKEFLSEYDFAEYMAKVASSEKFKNKMFHISGTYDVQYAPDKDRFYTNYRVNRVVLAQDDAEPKTEMKVDFYYGEDAWDDSQYEETGKCFVNGWVTYYDTNVKKNGFMPFVIAVKENEKKTAALKRKFDVDDGVKQLGITLHVIDGAEVVELTMDMLSEETREDIECGLIDWETYKRQLGGRAVGERISELRFAELTPKKNIVQDTVYSVDDMRPAKATAAKDAVVDEDEVDLFDDDEL